jgi:HSP20 family protein
MFYRFDDFDRTFAAMDQLRRRMDRLFDVGDAPREQDSIRSQLENRGERWFGRVAWPRLTYTDAGDKLEVQAEVPGIAEKDIQLTIQKDVLTVSGERKTNGPEGYLVHRQERAPVKFARSFTLPCKVDPERSQATLQNGVMTITLAKVPEAQPRQIAVRAG